MVIRVVSFPPLLPNPVTSGGLRGRWEDGGSRGGGHHIVFLWVDAFNLKRNGR